MTSLANLVRLPAIILAILIPGRAFAASGFAEQMISPDTAIYGHGDYTVSLIASTSITQDNNLFRLAGTASPVNGSTTKSDTITSAMVGFKLDKDYSLQHVKLEVDITKKNYSNFSYLNYDDTYFNGVWSWAVTPKITGALGASRRQTLNSFADTPQSYAKNLNTADSVYFNADWWFAARWHGLFNISETTSNNSVQSTLNISSRTTAVELGLRYESSPGNSVTAKVSDQHGVYLGQALDYVNLIDNGFHQRQTELDFTWLPTGRSSFSGNLVYMQRLNDHFSQRDISGISGSLGYNYRLGGKSSISIKGSRVFSPYFAANTPYFLGNKLVFVTNSSYTTQNDISIQPIWEITPRISANMMFDYGTKDYQAPISATVWPQQHDTNQSLSFGLNWMPTRYLSVSSSLQQSRRRSNNPGFEYDDIMASISAQLLLNSDF